MWEMIDPNPQFKLISRWNHGHRFRLIPRWIRLAGDGAGDQRYTGKNLRTEMLYVALKITHLLSVIVWLGGMVFAHFFLRPASATLAPPQRVALMHVVLGRFFRAVLWAASLALLSGVWMIGRITMQTVQSGAHFNLPLEWLVMASLGVLMMAIFGVIRFALYPRLTRAVAAADWPDGAAALAAIRHWVAVNLVLGTLIVIVTLVGGSS
jgi:uncharacterized membrane protein